MEFHYHVTEEAFLDFHVFHARNSEVVTKSMAVHRFLVPIIYLLMGMLALFLMDSAFWSVFVPALLLSVLWFVFYPRFFYRQIRKNARKMLREVNNEGVFEKHSIVFSEDGIREIGPKGEMVLAWSGIRKLGEDESYFYLYNSGMSAFILPKA